MATPTATVEDAINSMLRTEYIPLNDSEKLSKLKDYYVDYLGYLSQILSECDQLIVGRRGTGKTTLLYRAFVECMASWDPEQHSRAKPRTLGVYVDLSKCQSLLESDDGTMEKFERLFVSQICEAFSTELMRSWPDPTINQNFFYRLFSSAKQKKWKETTRLISDLARTLQHGVPRIAELARPASISKKKKTGVSGNLQSELGLKAGGASAKATVATGESQENEEEFSADISVFSEIMINDVLKILGNIRKVAEIPCVHLFLDEFSSLTDANSGV